MGEFHYLRRPPPTFRGVGESQKAKVNQGSVADGGETTRSTLKAAMPLPYDLAIESTNIRPLSSDKHEGFVACPLTWLFALFRNRPPKRQAVAVAWRRGGTNAANRKYLGLATRAHLRSGSGNERRGRNRTPSGLFRPSSTLGVRRPQGVRIPALRLALERKGEEGTQFCVGAHMRLRQRSTCWSRGWECDLRLEYRTLCRSPDGKVFQVRRWRCQECGSRTMSPKQRAALPPNPAWMVDDDMEANFSDRLEARDNSSWQRALPPPIGCPILPPGPSRIPPQCRFAGENAPCWLPGEHRACRPVTAWLCNIPGEFPEPARRALRYIKAEELGVCPERRDN